MVTEAGRTRGAVAVWINTRLEPKYIVGILRNFFLFVGLDYGLRSAVFRLCKFNTLDWLSPPGLD